MANEPVQQGDSGEDMSSGRSPSRFIADDTPTSRHVSKAEARAAAKAKVTVDRKLGKKTPSWVEALAEGA